MTVASQTRNWQKRPVGKPAPPKGPPSAPSLFPIRDYLIERWGGQSLSVENMWHERPIVGGTAPSSHRGAVFDGVAWTPAQAGRCYCERSSHSFSNIAPELQIGSLGASCCTYNQSFFTVLEGASLATANSGPKRDGGRATYSDGSA